MDDYFTAVLAVSILLLGISICLLPFLNYTLKKYDKKFGKENFFKLLKNNLKHHLVNDKEDILVLLNSISREYEINYSFDSLLEDYIVSISKNENDGFQKDEYDLIKKMIMIEKQEKPFNNVPEEEKRILISINECLKTNNLEPIKTNLKELSTVISTRNRIYEKTAKVNKLAITITIISVIVTIMFGIIGLQKIDYKKIEVINSQLIEKLQQNTEKY